ncbi:MAG: MFS transporter [Acidobacteria bacterium]|nr:MFS transporter [Acidobacteriota bacterium]
MTNSEMEAETGSSYDASMFVLLAEGFFSRLSFGIISFALPLYAYSRLGLSLTETGFLFSLNLIAEQLFKPLTGWVADRVGLKKTLTTAIALRSLVAFLLIFAGAWWQVYLIRFLHGLAESLRDPSVSALIAENAKKKATASAFAWYSTAKMTAGSIGSAIGSAIFAFSAENFSRVFLVSFALSVLPLYAVARYLKEPDRSRADRLESFELEPSPRKPVNNRSMIVSVVVMGFLMACTARMMSNLFPVLAIEYAGLRPAQMTVIYTIAVVLLIVSGPVFGWLSDNVSRKLVLMIRSLANAFSSVMFWAFPNFAGMAAGNIADSIGKAAFRPAWGAMMAHISSFDRKRRAQTMSYLSLGEGLGETAGPLLGGFLWSTWGLAVMLSVRIVLALLCEVYTIAVSGKIQHESRR